MQDTTFGYIFKRLRFFYLFNSKTWLFI